jgi:hypothetical protein
MKIDDLIKAATPGPFTANKHDECSKYIGDIEGRDSDSPHDESVIRTVCVVLAYAQETENKANLQLIAHWLNHAPELLHMLRRAYTRLLDRGCSGSLVADIERLLGRVCEVEIDTQHGLEE